MFAILSNYFRPLGKYRSIKFFYKFVLVCLLTSWLVISVTACNSPSRIIAPDPIVSECVDKYDPQVDYFPSKTKIKYAQGFTVDYQQNYKVVTVNQPYANAPSPVQYVLVQCGTPAPPNFPQAQIISIPVRSIVSLSTTHLPHLEALQILDRLVGVTDYNIIYWSPELLQIKDKQLTEIGKNYRLNIEKIIQLNPDLITAYGIGNAQDDQYGKLLELGLKVVLNSEYLENSPLARSEWLKFTALFFNQEELAEQKFTEIERQYQQIKNLTQNITRKPKVLTGSVYGGTWSIAGGKSYFAQFLADAGADYLWQDDDSTASLPLSFEAVFARANQAEVWLTNHSEWFSLQDIVKADPRYGELPPFRSGQVFNNNLRVSGGNDFWQGAVLHPELVLADLVKIFHPPLVPNHQFIYYQKLK
jgi:iron complex transport system substrate-binding protein